VAPPGVLVPAEHGNLGIATGHGALVPIEIQRENRKVMSWAEYLRGARLQAGAAFEGMG
jgi:methionyl-tRNA formyltransferase